MEKITRIREEVFYTFNSVEEVLKCVNLDAYREDGYVDFLINEIWWAEPIEDDFKEALGYMGFSEIDFCWDVSYTQGRGASFTGYWNREDMDCEKLEEVFPEDRDLQNSCMAILDLVSGSYSDCDCFNEEDPEDECGDLADYYKNYNECKEAMILDYARITRCKYTMYCHSNTMCVEAYDAEGSYRDDLSNDFEFIASDLADQLFSKLEAEFNYVSSNEYLAQFIVEAKIEIPAKYVKCEEKDEK